MAWTGYPLQRLANGELNRRVGAVLAIELVRFGQCERRLRHEARSRTPMGWAA